MASDGVIQPEDRISLAMWDNDQTSLLGQAGQKVIQLKDLWVSRAGTIFLPYVGDVLVAGMSITAARGVVEQRLAAITPSAQVQLNRVAGLQNSVQVISGCRTPALCH